MESSSDYISLLSVISEQDNSEIPQRQILPVVKASDHQEEPGGPASVAKFPYLLDPPTAPFLLLILPATLIENLL